LLSAACACAGATASDAPEILQHFDDLLFREFGVIASGVGEIWIKFLEKIAGNVSMLGLVFHIVDHEVRAGG
jgi:hypothetical protein